MVHSAGVCSGSIRRIVASPARVHIQIASPSLHSVQRCLSVSDFPQWLQRLVSVSRTVARRSFVGIRSPGRPARSVVAVPTELSRLVNNLTISGLGKKWKEMLNN